MKLLIASDLHGSAPYAEVLRRLYDEDKPDLLVLLGDLLYHGPRNDLPEGYDPKQVIPLLNSMQERILAVRGNCDSEVDQMVLEFPMSADYALLDVDGIGIYVCHGHLCGPQSPPHGAMHAMLAGHTHIGALEQAGRIVYLNPGSIAMPKDGHHSYMLYENRVFTRMEVGGAPLGEWRFEP